MNRPKRYKNNRVRKLLGEQGYQCFWCARKIVQIPTGRQMENNGTIDGQLAATIDHVISRGLGGSTEMDNLVASCYECNNKRNDEDMKVRGC